MKIFGKEFKFNGYDVYHKGNKPTAADVGAYTKQETDSRITDAQGAKVYVSDTQPSGAPKGSIWF